MPITPTRSNVTCRLNAKFQAALNSSAFRHDDGIIYGVSSGSHIVDVSRGNTRCCGIEELDFQSLQNVWENYPKNWNELVAHYVKASCERNDERVLFVGLPTKVGAHSMYTLKFYEKLRATLKEFGFKEVCKPYRNANSGNTIVVLAGQMPG